MSVQTVVDLKSPQRGILEARVFDVLEGTEEVSEELSNLAQEYRLLQEMDESIPYNDPWLQEQMDEVFELMIVGLTVN